MQMKFRWSSAGEFLFLIFMEIDEGLRKMIQFEILRHVKRILISGIVSLFYLFTRLYGRFWMKNHFDNIRDF